MKAQVTILFDGTEEQMKQLRNSFEKLGGVRGFEIARARVLGYGGSFKMTPGALAAGQRNLSDLVTYIERHCHGDWGDMPPEDVEVNEQAIKTRGRLMSSYTLKGGTVIWIITDAGWQVTTVLLPDEY